MLAAFSLSAAASDRKEGDPDNPFYGKTFSVMGDSIGTDNEGDTPLYTITFYNCLSDRYVTPDYTHPTQKGHEAMSRQALKDML